MSDAPDTPIRRAINILTGKAITAQSQAASRTSRPLIDTALARAEAYWDAVRTLENAEKME